MMYFTGISRANSSISRAFHGLLLKFHDVFTGFSSKQTQTEQLMYSGKPDLVRHRNTCWPYLLVTVQDKVFPGLDFGDSDD